MSQSIPETRFAKSGDVNLAYQVFGEGDRYMLLVPGWVSHVEYAWEIPTYAAFLRKLASFRRIILMDRSGTGLSDPVQDLPTLEQRMDEVRAVMDDAGVKRADLFGISEGGPMCMLFAATFRKRTSNLVLYGTFARNRNDDDHPWAPTVEESQKFLEIVGQGWGRGVSASLFAPSRKDDETFVREWGKMERMAASPGSARKILEMAGAVDVRPILPSIQVPTVVVHRKGDRATKIEGGRYIAEHIPNAKVVELEGADHLAWEGDVDSIVNTVQEFLTGKRALPEVHRILTTVVFVDIVESTEHAATIGDAAWRSLLERYYRVARERLVAADGLEVDTAGDGYFARFSGPARAVQYACDLRDAVRPLGVEIRAGVHTGECETSDDGLSGIAVHIGARAAAAAGANEILATRTVKDLVVGSKLRFSDRGSHVLKGVPDEWQLFAAEPMND